MTLSSAARFVQIAGIVGAIVGLLAQVRLAGGPSMGVVLFGPWLVLPFALAFQGLRTVPDSLVRVVGLGGMNAFGLAMYLDLLLASRLSSTAGLGFFFVPLWQVIGCAVVLVFTARRSKPNQEAG